ncbi:type I-E CRISPR-associated protein Cse2/CasB [Streptococcus mutans]|nr:type I-E CRISPR-associated protein Cse2/CasB [Streptococcus mutans]MCB5082605.1 type I-E CRISPR-associated protein Cse2/CasB [Streptococcus mutans]MCB5085594.1 type I-E CRISPR-associated protein Cse2/CasB [Streptococcus mutans]MCB5086425.1 type I-E CRISPR-associated protein Cse2/CasB [Streptococcus mutans]
MTEKTIPKISTVTRKILLQLSIQSDSSTNKAILAKLRQSIGKPLSSTTAVWPILFENLPEEFFSKSGEASKEEIAILSAIQLYALHKQEVSDNEREKYQNIGYSLKQLRKGDDTTAVDRRFNVMITSSTFEELIYHLRHLITLLKAKSPETKVDYARLSEDLYWFLRDYQETIRLNWAREYYKQGKGENDNAN